MAISGLRENELVTRYADQNYAIGACGEVVIAVWRLQTHLDAISMLSDYLSDYAAPYPKGLSLLQIIEDNASAPSPVARKSLAKMHDLHARTIRRSAVVYTKPGFAGATARAIITGVAMLNPPRFKHEHFATVSKALQWLEFEMDTKRTVAVLASLDEAVAELRATASYDPFGPEFEASMTK